MNRAKLIKIAKLQSTPPPKHTKTNAFTIIDRNSVGATQFEFFLTEINPGRGKCWQRRENAIKAAVEKCGLSGPIKVGRRRHSSPGNQSTKYQSSITSFIQ
tara:strand:- start:135 stop:437 length:303 start_codon:yes stop_codon:yes gene_type:complete